MNSLVVSLQDAITYTPYSIRLRLRLSQAYQKSGYPDLATGEAYVALLLVDECLGVTGEFEDEAFEAALKDLVAEGRDVAQEDQHDTVSAIVEGPLKDEVFALLIANLISCNNLKQAHDYIELRSKSDAHEPAKLVALKTMLQDAVRSHFPGHHTLPPPEEYPSQGKVRREVYPWNHHEPNRSEQRSLMDINELLRTAAPQLEARITMLPDLTINSTKFIPQIGLFAKEDIAPGEEALREKSTLTATSRLNDLFCDACSARLPDLKAAAEGAGPVSCEECQEIVFCSQSCHDEAQRLYHPAVCERDVNSIARDVPPKEAADSLYSLLLLRTFALAMHQDVHPLELIQVKYLCGDFFSTRPELPFSLYFNVSLPLQMLEKMDVNIFTHSSLFSPWIFNILYAKFRGTADARQGLDGKPEAAAVHPLWCLANHSCNPNARWEWQGSIKFWIRTADEMAQWGGKGPAVAGLKKDDEMFGHYCDISLPVKERREWARGALGGMCMCDRCKWEAKQEKLTSHVEKLSISKTSDLVLTD